MDDYEPDTNLFEDRESWFDCEHDFEADFDVDDGDE